MTRHATIRRLPALLLCGLLCAGAAHADKKVSRMTVTQQDEPPVTVRLHYGSAGRVDTVRTESTDASQQGLVVYDWSGGGLTLSGTLGGQPVSQVFTLRDDGFATACTTVQGTDTTTATFGYNDTRRLLSYRLYDADGTLSETVDQTYNAAGDITSLKMWDIEDGTMNITVTPGTRSDIAGLSPITALEMAPYIGAIYSGAMGLPSPHLPASAKTTVSGFPVTLNIAYTADAEGYITKAVLSAMLVGTIASLEFEYTQTGAVASVETRTPALTLRGGAVVSSDPEAPIEIYDLQGRRVAEGRGSVALPGAGGVYVARSGDAVLKAVHR